MELAETIVRAASSNNGTNLAQVDDWSKQLGLQMQMAKRVKGSPVIVPSIMHWKVGHFAALVAQEHGRYRLQDPTFGENHSLWISGRCS